jgi:hypothetical protein
MLSFSHDPNVMKRKRSGAALALEDAPMLSGDGATNLSNLDDQFKAIHALDVQVDAEA